MVGFDPGGGGSSVPALSCDPGFFSGVRPNYLPANAAAERVLINRAKTYASGCERRFGWLLPYMTTQDVARDMDSIRAAFGVSKINYYAFSYGTYIGQVYATLFPGRVRRMVLDSTVDPTGVWYADHIGQYQANGAQNENLFAVYNAVQCSDVNWPRSWARWSSDAKRIYPKAPFQAWDNTWFNAACAFWPVKGPPSPLRIKGTGLPGILMLQGTLDAATPYTGAQDAHKLLPSARMVVVEGSGHHGQSLEQPSNPCVQGYVNAYLGTGALPEAPALVNGTCPAVPLPTPGT